MSGKVGRSKKVSEGHGEHRLSNDQRCYLRITPRRGAPSIERVDSERELVPEFHRLKAEGVVFGLELGGMPGGTGAGPWISWRNQQSATPEPATCPHCGEPI